MRHRRSKHLRYQKSCRRMSDLLLMELLLVIPPGEGEGRQREGGGERGGGAMLLLREMGPMRTRWRQKRKFN